MTGRGLLEVTSRPNAAIARESSADVNSSNDHQDPLDDEPLFVPRAFEAEHLEEARRTIANNTGARRVARRLAASATGRGTTSAQQRYTRLVTLVHAIAVVVAVAISAVTETWLIGLAVTVMIGMSLFTAIRLWRVVQRVRAYEVAERQRH